MLTEWIKTIRHYVMNARKVMSKDVNGKDFSRKSQVVYHSSFIALAAIVVIFLPQGISLSFIDFIKDIFAIFVGFFVTVLTFVFDKLDVTPIPTQEEMNRMPADQRWDSKKVMQIKREHNYTIRFFYTVGLIILFSTAAICLLIPVIFWGNLFNLNMNDYVFVNPMTQFSWKAILLFSHLTICWLYRFLVIFLTIKVFYYTSYSVSSLLQVLILKKKMETWK